MPPKPTPERAAKFQEKFLFVANERGIGVELDQLPSSLRTCWDDKNYKQFLENATEVINTGQLYPDGRSELSDSDSDSVYCGLNGDSEVVHVIKSLLEIVPSLGGSPDKDVHDLIEGFYNAYHRNYQVVDDKLHMMSAKEYMETALGAGRRKLIPKDFKDLLEVFGGEEGEVKESRRVSDVKNDMIVFPSNNANIIAKNTLKVETEFANECRETEAPSERSILLDVAERFFLFSRPFKLDSHFPKRPGVYFLRYVGKRKLYGVVSAKKCNPIYIGMSTTDISSRLANHRHKIQKAEDLDVADFAVYVMFVDNRHYAPCIEGMLIEHFGPLWNKETVALCFGDGDQSLWKKVHIDQNADEIKKIQDLLAPLEPESSERDSEASDDDEHSQYESCDDDFSDMLGSITLSDSESYSDSAK